MAKNPFPTIRIVDEAVAAINRIAQIRDEDIQDFNGLSSKFIQGRKVKKVPTAYDDVAAGDRLGDFNFDSGYEYRLIDDSGTLKWARTAHGSISW